MSVKVSGVAAGAWVLAHNPERRPIVRLVVRTSRSTVWVPASRDEICASEEQAREKLKQMGLTRHAVNDDPLLELWLDTNKRTDAEAAFHDELISQAQLAHRLLEQIRTRPSTESLQ